MAEVCITLNESSEILEELMRQEEYKTLKSFTLDTIRLADIIAEKALKVYL